MTRQPALGSVVHPAHAISFRRTVRVLALSSLCGVLPLLPPAALVAEETAQQILDRQKRLDDTERHWNDRYQRMTMHITAPGGATRERELDVYERRYPDDEQRAVVFLRGPADVKDTAFLAYTHEGKAADQWLYLPAYKRIRQITANARNERFVGSDLTFADLDLLTDMPTWSEKDASAHLRGTETIGGVPCYVIVREPLRADIGYGSVVIWLGERDLIARQIELYEQAQPAGWLGSLMGGGSNTKANKRIIQSDIRNVGAIPVAYRIDVDDLKTGGKTAIALSDVQFNQNLPDDLFTQRALERGGK